MGGPAQNFDDIDKNDDGKVTKDEVADWTWERYSRADGDKDGALTRQEMESVRPFGREGRPSRSGRPVRLKIVAPSWIEWVACLGDIAAGERDDTFRSVHRRKDRLARQIAQPRDHNEDGNRQLRPKADNLNPSPAKALETQ